LADRPQPGADLPDPNDRLLKVARKPHPTLIVELLFLAGEVILLPLDLQQPRLRVQRPCRRLQSGAPCLGQTGACRGPFSKQGSDGVLLLEVELHALLFSSPLLLEHAGLLRRAVEVTLKKRLL